MERQQKPLDYNEVYKSHSCLVPFLLLLAAVSVGGYFACRHFGIDLLRFFQPRRYADVQIIDPSVGLVEKSAEPPPVQETVPEKPAEPPPPPKKTMRELKAEADAAQRALDVEIAKARVLNRGKELPSFAGIRFGEVMKGPARTPEAIVSGTGTNVSGYVRRMAGPKLKAPFRKFDNPPTVCVTPKSRKAYRIEFVQNIVRQGGWKLNPETTNVVEMMSRKLKCQPFSLDVEKYPLANREFVFPLGEMTVVIGEYGGTRLQMTLEHEGVRALAKVESEELRREQMESPVQVRALFSDRYPNSGLAKFGRVRIRSGTPKSFCGIVFGSLAPYSARIADPASAAARRGFYVDYRQTKCEPFMNFDHGRVETSDINGAVLAVNLYSDGAEGGLSDEEYFQRIRRAVERCFKTKPSEAKGEGPVQDLQYEVGDLRISLGPDPRGGFYLKAANVALQKAW